MLERKRNNLQAFFWILHLKLRWRYSFNCLFWGFLYINLWNFVTYFFGSSFDTSITKVTSWNRWSFWKMSLDDVLRSGQRRFLVNINSRSWSAVTHLEAEVRWWAEKERGDRWSLVSDPCRLAAPRPVNTSDPKGDTQPDWTMILGHVFCFLLRRVNEDSMWESGRCWGGCQSRNKETTPAFCFISGCQTELGFGLTPLTFEPNSLLGSHCAETPNTMKDEIQLCGEDMKCHGEEEVGGERCEKCWSIRCWWWKIRDDQSNAELVMEV